VTVKKAYSNLSDEVLIKNLTSANIMELSAVLLERYKTQIFGLALKYLKSVVEAEDACMEIYQLISRKLLKADVKSFKSWLFVVSRNYCLDLLRKKKRLDEKKDAFLIVQNEENYHPYNEEDDEPIFKRLEECVKSLSAGQQEMIRMFYLERKSYKEITETKNITWNKVRTLIQNGRRNLKICMEEK